MSLNFEVPLYSLIKDKLSEDNRVYSLLLSMMAEDRAIEKGTAFDKLPDIKMDYTTTSVALKAMRDKSLDYLRNSLNSL